MTKNGWDYVKHLLASAYCGHDLRCYEENIEIRKMIIAFMKDYNGLYSTIFVSLRGSPPKAYAILQVCDHHEFKLIKENDELKIYNSYSGKTTDIICVNKIKVLYSDLTNYRTIGETDMSKPIVRLSFEELFLRKDVIIMNAGAI
ncbi:hypothetical protein [Sulfolobus spindle-shaped virus]|nr:hypothetical protein [Sulfolobus spindle-shaped virus]AZG03625.1 hypothetical protein [Sulfolobus spindle-shaped virus]AZG03666.1 hypothetical protein [Sulfolobus spindle-shaped virus]AZG03803.1 hypothetical protein [Sulfolobus spindle-shaped virus]